MGGTDDPSNLVRLTIEEHAEAHRLLFEKYNSKFDYIAYMVLSKQIGHEEANYIKLLGPKNWTKEGKQKLSDVGKARVGEKNGFYGKSHTEETKQKLRDRSFNWIRGIDPTKLSYTKKYQIIYPTGNIKEVAGLKIIATEFNVSIENVHATIKRIKKGNAPKKGAFANVIIKEIT